MDAKDKLRFTRNWIQLKERVAGDLDSFQDALIEKFDYWINHKDEIDSAQSPQKKAEILFRKLMGSGKHAYGTFKDILLDRGYVDLVDKMEATTEERTMTLNDKETEAKSDQEECDGPTVCRRSELLDEVDNHLQGVYGFKLVHECKNKSAHNDLSTSILKYFDEFDQKLEEIKDDFCEQLNAKVEVIRDDFHEQLDAYENKIYELSKELKRYKEKLNEYENERMNLRTVMEDLRKKVSSLSKGKLKKKCSDQAEEITKLKQSLKELKERNKELEKNQKHLEAEISNKNRAIEELEKRINSQSNHSGTKFLGKKFKLREWLSALRW